LRRDECASTLLTSNRPVDDWGKLLGDTAAVTALLDRLLHHAHVLKCGPRSWRTKIHTTCARRRQRNRSYYCPVGAPLDNWLARSRQAWKIRCAQVCGGTGVLLTVAAIIAPRRAGLVPLYVGWTLLVVSAVLPATVRCRVCKLRIRGGSAARDIPRLSRHRWLLSLQLCPHCLDDGSATNDARDRWLQSGRAPEKPHWGINKVALAILAILLMLVSTFMVGEIYRVKP
jgi:hypothetical protein